MIDRRPFSYNLFTKNASSQLRNFHHSIFFLPFFTCFFHLKSYFQKKIFFVTLAVELDFFDYWIIEYFIIVFLGIFFISKKVKIGLKFLMSKLKYKQCAGSEVSAKWGIFVKNAYGVATGDFLCFHFFFIIYLTINNFWYLNYQKFFSFLFFSLNRRHVLCICIRFVLVLFSKAACCTLLHL